ncbi:DUF4375 domain-containing protein [Luteimonas sp. MC1828]|uniref:DMP19 family protein n=1 Tax=Luteimonas sp. MC1828 TaxID=2799787 RepID=UPI0018F1687B|nr:DUF4375 domain-containing protein [Luteimonas sp. MC1828]MBJ7575468.1 DUF4375 domain-containing protein [Luteimonas sp. MC1828]
MQDQSQSKDVVAPAYERLALIGGDPLDLDEPFRTVVLADTALGLIGNGGFEYFFESDFPGRPDYSDFAAAFENLGLAYLADGLRELVALFPFQAPHQERERRLIFLASPSSDFGSAASRLNERVWQDSSIDERLQAYGAAA